MAVVKKTITTSKASEANATEYPEELQFLLEQLLGSTNVYYQPPTNTKLEYPCITYQLDGVNSRYADGIPYRNAKRYLVTYISQRPDMFIPDKIGSLPTASFNRWFIQDNLNHWSYRLYFDARPNNI